MDIDKLKVAELRTELSNRGLDTKGTKPVLLARLREAMASDASPDNNAEAEEAGQEEVAEAQEEKEASPEPEVVEAKAVEAVEEEKVSQRFSYYSIIYRII